MGVTGVLGIFSSRLILGNFGIDAYAQYGMLNGLRMLLPFADLGMAAVVLNAISESDNPKSDERVLTTLTTTFRLLIISGLVIAIASVTLMLLGLWPAILGNGLMAGGELIATLCLVVFGLSLPLSLGSRILIGSGKNTLQIVILGLVSPMFVAALSVLVAIGESSGNEIALLSYVATSITGLICLIVAGRLISPALKKAAWRIPKFRKYPSIRILNTAGPALAISMATPIAMQTDRLFLSHMAERVDVATYNFASQIFSLILQTVVAAGLALWPFFAKARTQGRVTSPFPISGAFMVTALAMGAGIVMLMPLFERWVAMNLLQVEPLLMIGFVSFVAVQALFYPLNMYMTTPAGLKFQVIPVFIMVITNVALTWYFVQWLGAAGPVLASVIAIFVCQVIPSLLWIRRDLKRRTFELANSQ
ncbi:MAG: polysaccharide biosynthesis protein [Actinomycetales bacterium]|nr:polysaccharide biosynthesis protein [Actinomycetales bacterium]